MRGLNAVDVDEVDLQRYLKDWVQISSRANGNIQYINITGDNFCETFKLFHNFHQIFTDS